MAAECRSMAAELGDLSTGIPTDETLVGRRSLSAARASRLGLQLDPWFVGFSWTALLRKELPAPWLPPISEDGAAPSDAEFGPNGVMKDVPFDSTAWAPIFADFGPVRPTPLMPGEVGRTPGAEYSILS